MAAAPNGWSEIVAYYTLPERDAAGHPTADWMEQNLTLIESPFPLWLSWGPGTAVTHIRCHKKMAEALLDALNAIKTAAGDPKQAPGLDLGVWLGQDYGGCYCDRAIRGQASHLSMHAFGAAIDLRVQQNRLGTLGEDRMQNVVAPIFKKAGFTWGGDFESRKDPQHFQFASGY